MYPHGHSTHPVNPDSTSINITCTTAPVNATCTDPPDSTLGEMLSEFIRSHNHINPTNISQPDDLFWSSFRRHGNPQADYCPDEPKDGLDDPISERATCPFVYEIWSNSRMFPEKVSDAKCVCEHCLEPPYGNGTIDVALPSNTCEPLTVHVARLWKTGAADTANVCEWQGFMYARAVGCTCTRPRIGQAVEDTAYVPVFGWWEKSMKSKSSQRIWEVMHLTCSKH